MEFEITPKLRISVECQCGFKGSRVLGSSPNPGDWKGDDEDVMWWHENYIKPIAHEIHDCGKPISIRTGLVEDYNGA